MEKGAAVTLSRVGRAALLAVALAAAAGGAQQSEQADGSDAAGPRACLDQPMVRRTKVLDDRNIVFTMRDQTIYTNQLPKACTSLRRNSLVNYAVDNQRICAGHHFQILLETSPGNYTPSFVCQLGAFVPISEAELEDLLAMTEPKRERRSRGRSTREAVTSEEVELPPSPDAPAQNAPASAPAETSPAE